jgi:hypothetical protein
LLSNSTCTSYGESGVSAEEKCAALEAIDSNEMPTDLVACEKLLEVGLLYESKTSHG